MSDPASPGAPFLDASTLGSSRAEPALDPRGERPGDSSPLVPGVLLGGRFRIASEVGRGGMGVVYRATDEKLGEEVAIKVIRPDLAPSEAGKERFLREVRLARRLAHPSIVRLFELGEEGGLLFVAMELLDGEDLARAIERRGKLGVAEALGIVTRACEALETAHAEGIVHRDVKPRNVFLCSDGRVKLLDFGLSRALAADGASHSGQLLGTPAYMAPEQILPERYGHPDARADVYSMGLVLYETLTGAHPFPGDDPFEIALKRLAADPVPPRKLNRAIPRGIERIVLWALARRPDARPPSARALAQALAPWAGGAGTGHPGIAFRRLAILAAAGVFLIALLPFAVRFGIAHVFRAEFLAAGKEAAGKERDFPRSAAIALACPSDIRQCQELRDWVGIAIQHRLGNEDRTIERIHLISLLNGLGVVGYAKPLAEARELAARHSPPTAAEATPAPMPPPPTTGRIWLRSARPAAIFLDGRPLGRTPFEGEAPLGLHRLKFVDEATGETHEEIVTLVAEKPFDRAWQGP